jgi:hypothetical protein
MVYQEKTAAADPLAAGTSEPPDGLHLQRTIDSLERENTWLKAQHARIVRDK